MFYHRAFALATPSACGTFLWASPLHVGFYSKLLIMALPEYPIETSSLFIFLPGCISFHCSYHICYYVILIQTLKINKRTIVFVQGVKHQHFHIC
jgi:hypothetical protein